MDNIYEVERDEYIGFLDQVLPSARNVKVENNEGKTWYKTYSQQYKNLLCVREIDDASGEEKYFIFEMPHDDERRPAPAKRKIVLETKEEVQSFFEILSKVMEKKND